MFALIGQLAAFSPGLKPGRWKMMHSRGFENPLPRTESPGLAQLKLQPATKYDPQGLPRALALKMYKLQGPTKVGP